MQIENKVVLGCLKRPAARSVSRFPFHLVWVIPASTRPWPGTSSRMKCSMGKSFAWTELFAWLPNKHSGATYCLDIEKNTNEEMFLGWQAGLLGWRRFEGDGFGRGATY